jgi:ATP-dependent HslUV protease ATP-binding subunit HslU
MTHTHTHTTRHPKGRFPVRVELKPLDKAALIKILAEKKFNLIEQTRRLLATEGVTLEFTPDGVDEMAGFAEHINRTNQDIGARRLNTVLHRVLEDISFSAPRLRGSTMVINAQFVKERLQSFDPVKENVLSKYIL